MQRAICWAEWQAAKTRAVCFKGQPGLNADTQEPTLILTAQNLLELCDFIAKALKLDSVQETIPQCQLRCYFVVVV